MADGSLHFIVHQFTKQSIFYNYPYNSDLFHVYKVSELSETLVLIPYQLIRQKCIAIPHHEPNSFVIFPILHLTKNQSN